MANQSQFYGRESEEIAARYLSRLGYRIIERNFKACRGEIDLIASSANTLVFIEVKARRSEEFGGAAYSISPFKKRKIMEAAKAYMAFNHLDSDARFDVVLVRGSLEAPSVELIQDAFDLAS